MRALTLLLAIGFAGRASDLWAAPLQFGLHLGGTATLIVGGTYNAGLGGQLGLPAGGVHLLVPIDNAGRFKFRTLVEFEAYKSDAVVILSTSNRTVVNMVSAIGLVTFNLGPLFFGAGGGVGARINGTLVIYDPVSTLPTSNLGFSIPFFWLAAAVGLDLNKHFSIELRPQAIASSLSPLSFQTLYTTFDLQFHF